MAEGAQCYDCPYKAVRPDDMLRHVNRMRTAAANPHGTPPEEWLRAARLLYCATHARVSATRCNKCIASGRQGGAGSPRRAEGPSPVQARDLPRLGRWLREEGANARVQQLLPWHYSTPPRLSLPQGAAARAAAATACREILEAATEGNAAAQHLFTMFPRVCLQRGRAVVTCVQELMQGERPPPRAKAGGKGMGVDDAYVRRVREAIVERNTSKVLRLVEDGPSEHYEASARQAQEVINAKFPTKPRYPGGVVAEMAAVAELGRRTGSGRIPAVTPVELMRWARQKRRRAGDSGGWSPRLLLDLVAVDPSIATGICRLMARDPQEWESGLGAMRAWRTLRGGFIPQEGKPLPRPIAVPPLLRRAWGSVMVRRVAAAADEYCRGQGQYGMADAGGQLAYGLVARVVLAAGGTLVTRDKSNSFHELTRRAVVRGVEQFVDGMGRETREEQGRVVVEILRRCFHGASREEQHAPVLRYPRYEFGMVPPVDNPALCQGSPESSLMEALTYGATAQHVARGVVNLELHDDGYVAVMPTAGDAAFEARAPDDGSKMATEKWTAVGPRARWLVERGQAGQEAVGLQVCGVPVGDVRAGLERWRNGYAKRLSGIRRLAELDAGLAARAAMLMRGPGALALHLLRSLPVDEAALEYWRARDAEWVEVWMDIAHADASERERWREQVRDRVFLRKGHAGIGSQSAAESARGAHADGVRRALPHLIRILDAAEIGLNTTVWSALGAATWKREGGEGMTWKTLEVMARREQAAAEEEQKRIDGARHARVHEGNRATTGPTDGAPGAPNLYIQWMRGVPPGESRWDAGVANAVIAVRRALGLPVYGASIGMPAASDCGACNAVAHPEGERLRPVRPRGQFDVYGEHALTCMRTAVSTRRHNAVAYALLRGARSAGCQPQADNRTIMDGGMQRPGDVFMSRWPTKSSGMAVDVTVISKWAGTLTDAEEGKKKKYADYFRDYDTLGFTPFAIDLGGAMGGAAWQMIQDLGRQRALQPGALMTRYDAVQECLDDLAWTFVDEVSRQIQDAGIVQRQKR